jgi:hypothetical protein
MGMNDVFFSGIRVVEMCFRFMGTLTGTKTWHVPTSFSLSCSSSLFLTTKRYLPFPIENSSHYSPSAIAGRGGIVEGSAVCN